MKRIKQEKVKRGRIILSAILTFTTALISLGFGGYLGYVTLDINYLTIGTMTYAVGGLLVVAGFFIFFGCIGGVISLKEIFISSRNEEKFSAYKGALISAIIYYCVIAIISIVGIIMALVSYIPSNYTWTIAGLALVSLLLCAGSFYCVFKELKEHKKKTKAKAEQSISQEGGIANMQLNANDIHKLSETYATNGNKSNQNERLIETVSRHNGEINHERMENVNIRGKENAEYDEGLYASNKSYEENGQHNNYRNVNNYQEKHENASAGTGEEKKYVDAKQKFYEKNYKHIDNYLTQKELDENLKGTEVDFVSLAEKLMQLEELRKAGLINDQEYQALKNKCI